MIDQLEKHIVVYASSSMDSNDSRDWKTCLQSDLVDCSMPIIHLCHEHEFKLPVLS